MGNVPTSIPTDAAAVLGDDHPIVGKAVEALTFCHLVPVEEIPRDRAARLLDCWAHRGELSRREIEAILARFPQEVASAGEPS